MANPILFSENRDFLLNAAGDRVPANFIAGKVVGIFVGPHWLLLPLEQAIAIISEPCHYLDNKDVVFVYVAADRDEDLIDSLRKYEQGSQLDERPDVECFSDALKKLPSGWLAVPLDDTFARSELTKEYRTGIFSLAFVGADGRIHSKDGLWLLEKWGAEAYPFDDERINALQLAAQERKRNQSLHSLLFHENRDYLISHERSQVRLADIEGKIVGLYFSAHWCPPCQKFTPLLANIYEQLKEKNAEFEVVFISSDEDQTSFDNYFLNMPWLAVPYDDTRTKKHLSHWFEVEGIPTLVILDKQGKTLQGEGMELMYKYGIDAYPFTSERLQELKLQEDSKRAAQTLESLLITEGRDFVLSKSGESTEQVKVSSLKGKVVGLYFSGQWCGPCKKFTPKLKSVYQKLKDRGEEFEVVFLSSDRDEDSFQEYYGGMPWSALPFNDSAIRKLAQYFDVKGIPQLVLIGPDGKTIDTDGRGLVSLYGADAFPFTDDAIDKVKEAINVKAQSLPREIKALEHEHSLKLTDNAYEGGLYFCDKCDEQGSGWVYHCDLCGYDLHTDCAIEIVPSEDGGNQEGYICEGDVCRKVETLDLQN